MNSTALHDQRVPHPGFADRDAGTTTAVPHHAPSPAVLLRDVTKTYRTRGRTVVALDRVGELPEIT